MVGGSAGGGDGELPEGRLRGRHGNMERHPTRGRGPCQTEIVAP